jgi:hypothetical protein
MTAILFTRMRFRVALWWDARLLPLRVGRLPLASVLALARPGVHRHYHDLALAYIVRHVRRTLRRPLLMRDRRCLREGLLACRFLAAAGYEPELHFGIDRTSVRGPGVQAHCWVVHHGETVLNPPQTNMVTIFIHNALKPVAAVPTDLSELSIRMSEHAACPSLSVQ